MWNGRGVKRTRALGLNETLWGVRCPVLFCPRVPFCPNIPCSILPPRLRLEKSHYVNYNITRCLIKWCENENKKYTIISYHMQWFYYLICQSDWCQNATKLIHLKVKLRSCEILKTWSITSLVLTCDADLAEDRNQMDVKIDPHQAGFFQNTRCSILPSCFILLRLTIHVHLYTKTEM